MNDILFDNRLESDSYLNELPVVQYLKREGKISFSSPVTFFVGENGTGKSTLLEAIAVACGFNAEGGSRNFNFATKETHSELWKHLSVGSRGYSKDGFFLRAESLYNVATNIDEMDSLPSFDGPVIAGYGGISLHRQSHGESFLAIVQKRFFGHGLYILDEPEAALSPMKLLTLISQINSLVKKESQFIIATHSPLLMAFPSAEIFEFNSGGITKTDYKNTEHFKLEKSFFDDPERMIYYLLKD